MWGSYYRGFERLASQTYEVLGHYTFLGGGVGTGAELATVRTYARTRAAVPRGSRAYMAAAPRPAAVKAITSVLCGWGGGISGHSQLALRASTLRYNKAAIRQMMHEKVRPSVRHCKVQDL